MFKFVVAFVLAIVVRNITAITDEQRDEIRATFVKLGAECIKEFPITTDDITSFKDKKFPEGEHASCFTACVFKKAGIFDDKGNLSVDDVVDHAKKIFEDEDELKNIQKFLSVCSKVNDEEVKDGEKGCERAEHAYKCLLENSEEYELAIEL